MNYIIFLIILSTFTTNNSKQKLYQKHQLSQYDGKKNVFKFKNEHDKRLYNQFEQSKEKNKKSNIILNNKINQIDNIKNYNNNDKIKYNDENQKIQLLSLKFANNKKKLPWPIKKGIIISMFGQHSHPIISNIIINNTGIEFATYKKAHAYAVFEGKIFKIQSVPGDNKAIIIQHGDYFTTYTNLNKIFVKIGQKVYANQKIGKIYTDDDKNTLLKFQIWKGINTMDPSDWLINL